MPPSGIAHRKSSIESNRIESIDFFFRLLCAVNCFNGLAACCCCAQAAPQQASKRAGIEGYSCGRRGRARLIVVCMRDGARQPKHAVQSWLESLHCSRRSIVCFDRGAVGGMRRQGRLGASVAACLLRRRSSSLSPLPPRLLGVCAVALSAALGHRFEYTSAFWAPH
jgi:hypothetical protein